MGRHHLAKVYISSQRKYAIFNIDLLHGTYKIIILKYSSGLSAQESCVVVKQRCAEITGRLKTRITSKPT